ncbi:MAG: signal transduction histidine kinase [Pirellulaceae bacterium]
MQLQKFETDAAAEKTTARIPRCLPNFARSVMLVSQSAQNLRVASEKVDDIAIAKDALSDQYRVLSKLNADVRLAMLTETLDSPSKIAELAEQNWREFGQVKRAANRLASPRFSASIQRLSSHLSDVKSSSDALRTSDSDARSRSLLEAIQAAAEEAERTELTARQSLQSMYKDALARKNLMRGKPERIARLSCVFSVVGLAIFTFVFFSKKTLNPIPIENKVQPQAPSASHLKLDTVAQLTAGIAHELNTPLQYIGDNFRFLEDAIHQVQTVLDHYSELELAVRSEENAEAILEKIQSSKEDADLEFIREEMGQAIAEGLDGAERMAKIVLAMKSFIAPGTSNKQLVDLNLAVRNCIAISKSRWISIAELQSDLDDRLPYVCCHPPEVNQVLLHLILYASTALQNLKSHSATLGAIDVATKLNDARVAEITIGSSGSMTAEQLRDLFLAEGNSRDRDGASGGLAVCYSIITELHCGDLTCELIEGETTGFRFRITLPVDAVSQHNRNEFDGKTSQLQALVS